jgi:citrate lyase subunit beta/citryl-CoA lyase
MTPSDGATYLFVPGDRPDRYASALGSGASMVVLDLEDAVAPAAKREARTSVAGWLADAADTDVARVAVRVNPPGSPGHEDDMAALAATGRPCVVMVPKAEDHARLTALADALPGGSRLVALVETALGVVRAADLAETPAVVRLALGTFDLAAELGVDPDHREAMAGARGALVLASAAARLTPPVDGVTGAVRDLEQVASDALAARTVGFTGKLCIHPAQVPVVAAELRPTDAEVTWARRVLQAGDGGVSTVFGRMVDAPVLARAQRLLDAATTAGTQDAAHTSIPGSAAPPHTGDETKRDERSHLRCR